MGSNPAKWRDLRVAGRCGPPLNIFCYLFEYFVIAILPTQNLTHHKSLSDKRPSPRGCLPAHFLRVPFTKGGSRQSPMPRAFWPLPTALGAM
jgi:hypothetical protein